MTKGEYKEYLKSSHWITLRARIRVETPYCEICGAKGMNIHHLTYERLWNERREDLLAVCEKCHKNQHFPNMKKKKKSIRRGMLSADQFLKEYAEKKQRRKIRRLRRKKLRKCRVRKFVRTT